MFSRSKWLKQPAKCFSWNPLSSHLGLTHRILWKRSVYFAGFQNLSIPIQQHKLSCNASLVITILGDALTPTYLKDAWESWSWFSIILYTHPCFCLLQLIQACNGVVGRVWRWINVFRSLKINLSAKKNGFKVIWIINITWENWMFKTRFGLCFELIASGWALNASKK